MRGRGNGSGGKENAQASAAGELGDARQELNSRQTESADYFFFLAAGAAGGAALAGAAFAGAAFAGAAFAGAAFAAGFLVVAIILSVVVTLVFVELIEAPTNRVLRHTLYGTR